MERLTGLLGIAVLLALAWFFSTNRKAIRIKTVAWGLGLQLLFALLVLRWEPGREALAAAGAGVKQLLEYSFAGSTFVFGELGAKKSSLGFYFAFTVLPTIIF
ncbi:MAG: Na+ dependent nucleoside transporter N-terminal domain-containing protein, partial [Terriglobales bacterium]